MRRLILLAADRCHRRHGQQRAAESATFRARTTSRWSALAGLETEYGAGPHFRGRAAAHHPHPTGGNAADGCPRSCSRNGCRADRSISAPIVPDLLGDLASQSGMVLIRVDRAGTGDSEGPACDRLDYDTEVRHYREAFDQLARHAWVDPDTHRHLRQQPRRHHRAADRRGKEGRRHGRPGRRRASPISSG